MKNSSFLFSLLYIFSIVLCLLYPDVPLLGGLTVRHIVTLVMLFSCIVHGVVKKNDWFIWLFMIFVFFYFLSGLITGYVNDTVKSIFGTYLSAVVLYWSTIIMVEKNNGVKTISIVLLIIFLFDAIITIGQRYQIPFFIVLPEIIGIDLGDEFLVTFDKGLQSLEGYTLAGLFGSVGNGYVLSAAVILSWFPFFNKRGFLNIFFGFLFLIASFFTQERAGFFLAIGFTSFLFLLNQKTKQKNKTIVLLVIVFFVLLFYGRSLLSIVMTERYAGDVQDTRAGLFSGGLEFVKNNIMGGVFLYKDTHTVMPHNLLINAFVTGGVFGGVAILIAIFKQVLEIVKYILRDSKENLNWPLIVYGLMYLDYSANSLVHNQSLIFGSALFFVFWGVFSGYKKIIK